jgi:NTE family protein
MTFRRLPEGHAKDDEFSATSMRERWHGGYEDTRATSSTGDG